MIIKKPPLFTNCQMYGIMLMINVIGEELFNV